MRAMDLGGVHTPLLGAPDAVRVGPDELFDVFFEQRVGHVRLIGILYGRRRHRRAGVRAVAPRARVVDLREAGRSFGVHHVGAFAHPRDHRGVVRRNALGARG